VNDYAARFAHRGEADKARHLAEVATHAERGEEVGLIIDRIRLRAAQDPAFAAAQIDEVHIPAVSGERIALHAGDFVQRVVRSEYWLGGEHQSDLAPAVKALVARYDRALEEVQSDHRTLKREYATVARISSHAAEVEPESGAVRSFLRSVLSAQALDRVGTAVEIIDEVTVDGVSTSIRPAVRFRGLRHGGSPYGANSIEVSSRDLDWHLFHARLPSAACED
jgi:hypothetical protein